MKNLKFMFFGMLMLLSSMAMAQTNFSNTTANYYVGAFHTTAISGCPTTALTTFYYDIPDGVIGSSGDIYDENGNLTTAGNITGITVEVLGSSSPDFVSFCGSTFGSATLPSTGQTLSWTIVGTLVIVSIT